MVLLGTAVFLRSIQSILSSSPISADQTGVVTWFLFASVRRNIHSFELPEGGELALKQPNLILEIWYSEFLYSFGNHKADFKDKFRECLSAEISLSFCVTVWERFRCCQVRWTSSKSTKFESGNTTTIKSSTLCIDTTQISRKSFKSVWALRSRCHFAWPSSGQEFRSNFHILD